MQSMDTREFHQAINDYDDPNLQHLKMAFSNGSTLDLNFSDSVSIKSCNVFEYSPQNYS